MFTVVSYYIHRVQEYAVQRLKLEKKKKKLHKVGNDNKKNSL